MSTVKHRRSLRYHVLKWHHRVGLILVLFVFVMATTGIALNHGNQLAIDQQTISNRMIRKIYGIELPNDIVTISGLSRKNTKTDFWITQIGHTIYFNDTASLECQVLVGAVVMQDDLVLIGCDKALSIYTVYGEHVETINSYQDLPTPLTGLGLLGSDVVLQQSNEKLFKANIESLTWKKIDHQLASSIQWASRSKDVSPYYAEIQRHYLGNGITLERLLLDIHSGRVLGKVGVLFNDLIGVLLLTLALSGFWMTVSRIFR